MKFRARCAATLIFFVESGAVAPNSLLFFQQGPLLPVDTVIPARILGPVSIGARKSI